jgi:AAA domain-containing protein
MIENVVKLRDAFGVGREEPLNYVERNDVDGRFVESLTRDKHVVVYGSSKQGKTTLRKHSLNDDDYIVVSCLNSMNLDDLHGAILKAAGYRIERTQIKTVGGKWKYGAQFKGEGKVPFLATASGTVDISRENAEEEKTETTNLEIDLFDVNDIIAALNQIKLQKFIILEDFHYLPVECQKNFSFALKTFHENSDLCFIVVGVWRDKNKIDLL